MNLGHPTAIEVRPEIESWAEQVELYRRELRNVEIVPAFWWTTAIDHSLRRINALLIKGDDSGETILKMQREVMLLGVRAFMLASSTRSIPPGTRVDRAKAPAVSFEDVGSAGAPVR